MLFEFEKRTQKVQEELSSVKLIIELLQKEDSAKEHKGYGTTEPRNSIQRNDLKAGKTTENEWIEVNPSQYKRTKQVKIDPSKWQLNIVNRYEVLDNLQEPIGTIKGLNLRKIRGVTKVRKRNLIKRDHKVLLIGDNHAGYCAEKNIKLSWKYL